MSKNTSIILKGRLNDFIEAQVQTGHYASASDVIRAGLRLLEEREVRIQHLRGEIQKGLDSGIARDFNMKSFLAERHAEFEKDNANG